jgi:hypothetical protein
MEYADADEMSNRMATIITEYNFMESPCNAGAG